MSRFGRSFPGISTTAKHANNAALAAAAHPVARITQLRPYLTPPHIFDKNPSHSVQLYGSFAGKSATTITSATGTVSAAAAVTTHGTTIQKVIGSIVAAALATATGKAVWRSAGTVTATATVAGVSAAAGLSASAGTVTATSTVTATGTGLSVGRLRLTQLMPTGWPGQRYGSFAGKSDVPPAAVYISGAGVIVSTATASGDAQAVWKTVGTITATATATAHGATIKKSIGTVGAAVTAAANGTNANSAFAEAMGTVSANAAVTAAAKVLALAGGSSVAVSSVQAIAKIIHAVVGSSQAEAIVSGASTGGAVPEVPPTPTIPPPQFAGWENTYLHATQTLGGQGPVGSGSPGGTTWEASTSPAGAFNNTYLHDIRTLGGMMPGAGSPGGTVWEVTP